MTPWTATHQASLSFTISWSLLRLMSTESVMPSNHLILCRPLLPPSILPSIRVFCKESVFASGGQSIGASASTSVLPMNIQGLFPLGWTGWMSLQSKGLSRVFSTPQFESINSLVLIYIYIYIWPFYEVGTISTPLTHEETKSQRRSAMLASSQWPHSW